MAGVAEGVELVEPGTPGAVQCSAPGCANWFVKRSGRHIYCKAPDCTYRRDAPPAPEVVSPEGAALEVLRRLQESDEAEVGPALLVERYRTVQEALRAADPMALFGALVDVGTAAIWWADRAARGELPTIRPVPGRGAPVKPTGLAHAVLASHRRTYALGDQRVDLVYALFSAREQLASATMAVAQTQGSPNEETARAAQTAARQGVEQAERALQSVEAAWRERGTALTELDAAAAASAPPTNGNGHTR